MHLNLNENGAKSCTCAGRDVAPLMNKTIAVHVRYDSLHISLPSSAKQQREMTKFRVVWRT